MKKDSRRLSSSREEELSDLGEVIAARHKGLIDPIEIAHSNRITLSFGDYADAFDGLLEAKAGAFHIYCNLRRVEQKDSARSRFTLAHELGHYFIDEHRNALLAGVVPSHPSFCDYQSSNLVEVEADCFASSLLMPFSRFSAAANEETKGLVGVLNLASLFQTSISATAIRYLQMNLFPCVIIKWNKDGGYSWKRLSRSAYLAKLRKTVDNIENLPRDCPTAKVLKKTTTGLVESGTTKATWFPFVHASCEDNSIFYEQAISLGKYGALTFIYPENFTTKPR